MNPTSSQRSGVLAGGNWIVDHVKMIDAWPPQDCLASISTTSRGNGGCAYNLLKALAKMECAFPLSGVGLIGDDPDGEWILNDCREHGIDVQFLGKTAKAGTSFGDVMTVESTGRRTFFHYPGANALLSESDFDLPQSSARIFHLGYLALLAGLDARDAENRTGASRLFEQAGKLGMVTMADLVSNPVGSFSAIIDPSLPWLDYILLNEFEASRLLEKPMPQETEGEVSASWLMNAAEQILERGVREAAIIHTPRGAVSASRKNGCFSRGSVRFPREAIRGAVGAGDAFGAGCVFGIHEGWAMQETLELAVCSAASSLRSATCSESIEPWQTCLNDGRLLGFNHFADL